MRATKREIVIAACGFVAALVIVGGGLWWHGHSKPKQLSRDGGTTGNPQISLGQESPSDDSGGLSVNGQASNLGQLGSGSGGSQSQNGGGGDSGSSSGIDPSAFSQYDKYKNNKAALFGDIQVGNGAQLKNGKKASIYYKAWLTNGSLVDQSPVSNSGQPQAFGFTLGAHQVIPGLEEGVYDMKAGGKRLVIVPPAVGYGSKGQGAVPPGAIMVFEVQLLSVQ